MRREAKSKNRLSDLFAKKYAAKNEDRFLLFIRPRDCIRLAENGLDSDITLTWSSFLPSFLSVFMFIIRSKESSVAVSNNLKLQFNYS